MSTVNRLNYMMCILLFVLYGVAVQNLHEQPTVNRQHAYHPRCSCTAHRSHSNTTRFSLGLQ